MHLHSESNECTNNMNVGHTAGLCLQSLIIIILDFMSFWHFMPHDFFSRISLKPLGCPWAGWQMQFFHDAIGSQYVNRKPHHSFYNVLHSQMPHSVYFFLYYVILIGSKEITEQHACHWQWEEGERDCLHSIRCLEQVEDKRHSSPIYIKMSLREVVLNLCWWIFYCFIFSICPP